MYTTDQSQFGPVTSRRTLLGVWAHPDDEAYMSAGLMAEFRRRGDRVVVLMATLGEHGTADPEGWPPSRLGALRHRELRNSLAAVGVHEIRLLGLEDGHCDEHDLTHVIGCHIAELGPDVIVTFGPDGLTGHPDHKAVCRWTTDAWAARPIGDLWYATVTPEFHLEWGAVNQQIGLWSEQPDPPCTDAEDLVHSTRLRGVALHAKIAALRAHASQTAGLIEAIGPAAYREWWRTESFRRADELASAGHITGVGEERGA